MQQNRSHLLQIFGIQHLSLPSSVLLERKINVLIFISTNLKTMKRISLRIQKTSSKTPIKSSQSCQQWIFCMTAHISMFLESRLLWRLCAPVPLILLSLIEAMCKFTVMRKSNPPQHAKILEMLHFNSLFMSLLKNKNH